MGWRTCWLILTLTLIARATATAEDSLPCQAVVWASDGGKWSVGGTGKVFCTCDSSDGIVADLRLLLGGRELKTDNINSTTVVYTTQNATETVQDTYECWGRSMPLESVQVTVFAGLNVKDLTCRFRGENHLNCSFSRAEDEHFWNVTRYRLTVGTGLSPDSPCTAQQDNPARMQCVLQTTDWAKRFENQHLTLTMLSDLEGRTQTADFDQPTVKMKVPEWPADEMNMTLSKPLRCVSWTNEQNLVKERLEWQVELRPRRLGIPSQNLTLPGREKEDERTLTICFMDPPQANQVFDVRLKLRFNETGAIWSEYYPEFNFTTDATVPARPPQFLPNGFYYNEKSHELTVFWFQLEELEYNGANLTYAAFCDGSQEANRYGSSSATFENWNDTKRANVTVRSRNIEGFSVNSSWLLVPRMSDVEKRQSTLLQYDPADFRLTWKQPEDNSQLKGYNVYWCNASDILGHFCRDGAHIQHISLDDGDRSEHTFTSSMALMDMAVAANYSDQDSGGMNLRLVADVIKKQEQYITKARVLEAIGALLVLGLVVWAGEKLRQEAKIEVELPEMGFYKQPKATPMAETAINILTEMDVRIAHRNKKGIELVTFSTNGGPVSEAVEEEREEDLDAVPASQSGPYVRMDNGNAIRPPPPQSVVTSDDYVMPPQPQLGPNNEAHIDPHPPRLIPNIDGYINPPRSSPNNNGYGPYVCMDNGNPIRPPPPQSRVTSDEYVMPPPPQLSPNNEACIDPQPPRLIPNIAGYVSPPPPRLSLNIAEYVRPPPPK